MQYLEYELLAIFAAAIIAIGTFIVLKDRSKVRKEQADVLNVQKAPMTAVRRRPAQSIGRQRDARHRMARQRA